jgi:GcvH upstream region-like protein
MLDFFRRHQRYFFFLITIVIVISFSFFGTYNSLSDSSFREQVAFTAVNGSIITRHQLDEMATFIGTDAKDKLLLGGMWGPNFLNDGVIAKNFLETGLGVILASTYPEDIQQDLSARLEKEKRFSLYVHPQAKFIGTETAWNYFAPGMANYYHALRASQNPLQPQALQARVALYLTEKQFPQHVLNQVLRYQEKQYDWIKPDRNLDRTDLSLFGYHTLEDWFGPRFIRLASEFIMNAAIIAQQKGYEVTKAEALANLIRNAEISYQQNKDSPNIGVASGKEYFNEQLRRLGLDQNGAAAIWRQVMLFRLLFQDMASSIFIDPYTFEKINAYASESVDGEIYRLPKEMHLKDFKALQKFETYLDAVGKRSEDDKAKLRLPTSFMSADQIAQKTPELVQKKYNLEIAQVNKKNLEGNVGLKDSWEWEVSDKGWEQLKKKFSELGVKAGASRSERFAALDALDDKTRGRIDAFARAEMVNEHPEWIKQALDKTTATTITVGLHEKGENPLFIGLKNPKALIQLLDNAPLAGQTFIDTPAAKDAAAKLDFYTADQNVYYRIKVLNRAVEPEVLTFVEAYSDGSLDKLLDKQLEAAYPKIREENPKSFQKGDKSWKDFVDVKEAIAERYFAKTLETIKNNFTVENAPTNMIPDYAATMRLYPYVNEIRAKLLNEPALIPALTTEVSNNAVQDNFSEKKSLADQWKLERAPYQASRSSANNALEHETVFQLTEGEWTQVNTPANGDLNFFHLLKKSHAVDEEMVKKSISQARRLMSDDVQQKLMDQILEEIKNKGAISLDYLQQVGELDRMNRNDLQED